MSARKKGNDASMEARERDNACRWASSCEKFGLSRSRHPFPQTAVGELAWRIYCEVAGRTIDTLSHDLSPKNLLRCVRMVIGANDTYLNLMPTEMPSRLTTLKLACQKGCSHCCSIRITTVAPYVLLMADAIQHGDQRDVRERIQSYLVRTGGLKGADRTHALVPCPLLNGDVCSHYRSRPASCRGCHSFDVRECMKTKDSRVPQSSIRQTAQYAVNAGFDDALRVLGLDARELEFVPALEIALKDDRCLERWLAHEDVFGAAHRPDLLNVGERPATGQPQVL